MKVTVADVKKYMGEGFEFVEGDIVTDGDKEIVMTAVMANAASYHNSNITSLQYRMVGFYLRENKGIQPVGDDILVMAVDRKCGEYLDHEPKASSLDWCLDGMSGDVIHWKPCLKWIAERVEKEAKLIAENKMHSVNFDDKPVFTQAMADAGEMIKAGMMFSTECGEYKAEIVNDKSVAFIDEHGFIVAINAGYAKPIKLAKDKEIDAMLTTAIESDDDIAKQIIYEACVKLHAAGYTKESNNV